MTVAVELTEDGITGRAFSMYVWLDAERYGLPANTERRPGQHEVYLPVAGYLPRELRSKCVAVSQKAQARVDQEQEDYRRARFAEDVARAERNYANWESVHGKPDDPAMVPAWRQEIERKAREWDRGINEGGDGYNPYRFGG